MEQQRKHHFLYYIFRSDKEACTMDEKKVASLKQYLLRWFGKGE